MDKMNITSAQYQRDDNREIVVTINGEELIVPVALGNRHYDEIMKQVAAGDLTIADAD